MQKFKTLKNLAMGTALMGGMVFAVTPPANNLNVYYGLMHSHTMTSDGSGTPEEAYVMAKQNGLDFFAETPHNHKDAESSAGDKKDGILIAKDHDLYNGTSKLTVTRRIKDKLEERVTLKPHIMAANDAMNEKFCALYGQEFSTISSGNHVNVIGIDEVITVANGDYKGLLDLLNSIRASGKPIPILQMNHPDVTKDLFYKGSKESEKQKMFNDYGIDDLGPHYTDYFREMSPYLHLIEMLSGPAMAKQRNGNYKYHSHENDYYFYLKQGLMLSPSAGQDNHYKTWGAATDARMGVLASSLTRESLMDAVRKHRTFATTDKNLKAILYVNNAVMGSSIKATDESQLRMSVVVEDGDEANTSYTVQVYGGVIEPELCTEATNWHASDGLLSDYEWNGNGTLSIDDIFMGTGATFFYVKITQDDGDEAWTAPVWINYDSPFAITPDVTASTAMYFWSKSSSSKVYHKQGCTSVDRIQPQNRLSGTTPPSGRSLHQCYIPSEEI